MNAAHDSVLTVLNDIIRTDSAAAASVQQTLRRVVERLDASTHTMEWEIVPLTTFSGGLPESIRSCWIFVIRPNAATGAERHPNSHQRSLSLIGTGAFELYAGGAWQAHPLGSGGDAVLAKEWISIPPSTWHRLAVGPQPWGVLSFHTVAPEELIEETPVDTDDLDGHTRQQRYAGRR
jgi:hypothetical protein